MEVDSFEGDWGNADGWQDFDDDVDNNQPGDGCSEHMEEWGVSDGYAGSSDGGSDRNSDGDESVPEADEVDLDDVESVGDARSNEGSQPMQGMEDGDDHSECEVVGDYWVRVVTLFAWCIPCRARFCWCRRLMYCFFCNALV